MDETELYIKDYLSLEKAIRQLKIFGLSIILLFIIIILMIIL